MQPTILHLIDHRRSTGEAWVMEDGHELPRQSRVFALTDEDVKRAAAGQITVTICQDCREIEHARRMREEEKQRRIQSERDWEAAKDRIARVISRGQVAGADSLDGDLARCLDDVAGLVASMTFEEGVHLLVERIEEERGVWALERGDQA